MNERDTSREAHRIQVAAWQRMGGAARCALSLRMADEARELARSGIRSRHPDYDGAQVEHALRRLLLGDTLFHAAWPDAPLVPA